MIGTMEADTAARFVLELDDPATEPISGWLREATLFQRRFHGVLGLLAALDAARDAVVTSRSPAREAGQEHRIPDGDDGMRDQEEK